jgi:hypothetical protein
MPDMNGLENQASTVSASTQPLSPQIISSAEGSLADESMVASGSVDSPGSKVGTALFFVVLLLLGLLFLGEMLVRVLLRIIAPFSGG